MFTYQQVEVNERCIRNMYIVNSGKFHFDYTWELREKIPGRDQIVQITPDKGGVKFGDREVCQLSFCPPRSMTLSGCDLVLKVGKQLKSFLLFYYEIFINVLFKNCFFLNMQHIIKYMQICQP